MTDILMICGNTGAGKSTYAAKVAKQTGAHVFAVDEWMRVLFHADMPDPPDYTWALERTQRCDRQILKEALRLAERGIPVILDLGFFGFNQREQIRHAIRAGGHHPVLHYLDTDKHTRWARVQQRNRAIGETFQFEVDRETFEFCETIFEPLTADERERAIIVS